jgi:hypothetical protein
LAGKKGGGKNFPAAPEEETGNEVPMGNHVSYKTHKHTKNITRKYTMSRDRISTYRTLNQVRRLYMNLPALEG